MSLNKDMGDVHEKWLADLLKMRGTRGSGNQWRDPMDAKHNRLETNYAFAIDGKSTLGKSIGVTRAMWHKAVEQAGGERPLLGLRFYKDASLSRVDNDLITSDALDFAELHQAAQLWEQAQKLLKQIVDNPALFCTNDTGQQIFSAAKQLQWEAELA